jgi:hypothetical protein
LIIRPKNKEKKGLALKVEEEESGNNEESLGLKHNEKNLKKIRKSFKKGNDTKKKEKVINCYDFGELSHIKSYCPNVSKVKGKSHHKSKGGKPKGRRIYITWDEGEESSSSSDSDNEEISNLCLMAHAKKSKYYEVSDSDSDSENLPFYDELQSKCI